MKIALFGATGMIGGDILREALERNHTVTAIVRDPARLTITHDNLAVVTGDATDPASVAERVRGHDIVIGSISGRRNGNAGTFLEAGRALLSGASQAGVKRLIWVGGAGSLEIAPGVRLVDTPAIPDAYKAEVLGQADTLAFFREVDTDVDWTYFSPAGVISPGERTGTFRLGADQLVTDAEGNSAISTQDYAVALLDEVEQPRHIRRRFTVAY